MSTKIKRTLCGIGAMILALILAIGGTFAYTLFEHKSNTLKSDANYQARLIEDFDKDPEWIVDQIIKKEISVKNLGGTKQFPGKNWGNIYVRVQLKEHMDITPVSYVYFPKEDTVNNTRFMVDKNGDFVRFPATGTIDSQLEAIKGDAAWNSVIDDEAQRTAYTNSLQASDFVKIKGYYDGDQYYWYVVTKEGDPNGQYGAYVVMDKVSNTAKSVNITDSVRAADVNYSGGMVNYNPADHETEECLYPIHKWGADDPVECNMGTHKYVDWNLGSSVVMMSEWDGKPIDKWILDPATGWATWGNAIKPGRSTDKLLESIKPIEQPDGEMFYVLHVEMEATDLTEMGDDWVIKGIFGEKARLKFEEKKVDKNVGDLAFQSPAIPGFNDEDYELINWDSSDKSVATVDNTGKVTIEGEGKTTVKVTVKPKDGSDSYEISYELTVSNNSPQNLDLNENAPEGGPHLPAGVDDGNYINVNANFYVYGYVFPGDRIDLTHNGLTGGHYGGIKLADIINGSYEGIDIDYEALALADSRFNASNLYIGKVHGEDCIVWAYAPTQAEFDQFVADNPTASHLYIDLKIPLTDGTLKGSVNVRMLYSGSASWE